MSADNYYVIQQVEENRFDVRMGFASDDGGNLGHVQATFDNIKQAEDYCRNEYSEYGHSVEWLPGKSPTEQKELQKMKDRLDEAEKKINEEARLNGMGGEREAALLGKLAGAEKIMGKMGEALTNTDREVGDMWLTVMGKEVQLQKRVREVCGYETALALYNEWKKDK